MLSCERSALDINGCPVSVVESRVAAANAVVNEAFLCDAIVGDVNDAFLDGGDDLVLSAMACIFSRYCCVSVIMAVGSGSILYIVLRLEYRSQHDTIVLSPMSLGFVPIPRLLPINLENHRPQSHKPE